MKTVPQINDAAAERLAARLLIAGEALVEAMAGWHAALRDAAAMGFVPTSRVREADRAAQDTRRGVAKFRKDLVFDEGPAR